MAVIENCQCLQLALLGRISSQFKKYILICSLLPAPNRKCKFVFFKIGLPRPLFHLFSYFQTQITIFTANKCEKCISSIQCRDLNSQHLKHESPPITTRLGLPFVMLQKLLLRECTLVRYYVLDLYLPTIGIHAYWDK